MKDGVVLQQFNLGARINSLSFKQDPEQTYTLQIGKKGYGFILQDFVYSDLIENLNGSPWTFTMTEAFSMIALPTENDFSFHLDGWSGSMTIDWGDGTVEQAPITQYGWFIHAYPSPGRYAIRITGDLNKIEEFNATYSDLDEIDLYQLTELEDYRHGWAIGPKTVDLSRCLKLTTLRMSLQLEMQEVIIPMSPYLSDIDLDGPNKMTTAAIDALINTLHETVVLNGIFNGRLRIRQSMFTYEEGFNLLIGPPSPASITLLEELRDTDTYEWEIVPEF